jgi:hypothetical protein
MNLAEYDSHRQVADTKSGPVGYIDVGSGRTVIAGAERDFAAVGVVRYAAWRAGSWPAVAVSTQLRASHSSPARRPRPRTAGGVQTALLSARLADAAAAGCDIAVVTTQPGSKSQQNVQRRARRAGARPPAST